MRVNGNGSTVDVALNDEERKPQEQQKRNPLASWEGVPEEAGTLFYEDREHRLGLLQVAAKEREPSSP
jgi:hypothetical protein